MLAEVRGRLDAFIHSWLISGYHHGQQEHRSLQRCRQNEWEKNREDTKNEKEIPNRSPISAKFRGDQLSQEAESNRIQNRSLDWATAARSSSKCYSIFSHSCYRCDEHCSNASAVLPLAWGRRCVIHVLFEVCPLQDF